MPQLAQLGTVYQSQWFWLLLVLGAIYLFVGRGIVPKVEATIDDRDAKIAADLGEAERLRDEADRTEEAWRTRINDAHAEGHLAMVRAKTDAERETEQRVRKADAEIGLKADAAAAELNKAREGALAEIEAVAADAARQIVAKLTGSAVSEDDARRAVAGALTHG
jgi:F-type H+-transporting ATPase subunit b